MEKRKTKIGKTLRGLLWMLVLAALAVALLAAANRLPSLMQKGFAREYDSVEAAKRALDLDAVSVPAYFPEGITWPPSFILAQRKPYPAVVMEFKEATTGETVLIVIQSSLRSGGDAQLQRIRLSEVKEETRYPLKGKMVLLQVGVCGSGPCSRMTWQDGALRFTVLLRSSPFELIRIAESMIR